MRLVPVEKLIELQSNVDAIRNICILAHVDHGKTTLADSLVASNGVISSRMVGKLRYMDSLPDEQERGITMKSSAIALYFVSNDDAHFLVNVIDSPGHVDFCGEVSTATRLCDGALIVVDVVEGVCPQTHAVLRQAWIEGLKPILILNKIDRLILELKMTSSEIYKRLSDVLGQVNAVAGELFVSKMIRINEESVGVGVHLEDDDGRMPDDEDLYFNPDNGNVLFASAVDGWAFRVEDFAKIWSTKANISESILKRTLWGDYYLDVKAKRIRRGAYEKGKKPLFVQLILDNVCSAYEAIVVRRDKEASEKIVTSLNMNVAARDVKHNDPRVYLRALFQQWLPLSDSVLSAVCQKLPSPASMEAERASMLMSTLHDWDSMPDETKQLKEHFLKCSSDEKAPTIVFVSKLFAVETKQLCNNSKKKKAELSEEEIRQRRQMIIEKQVRFDDENLVEVKAFEVDEAEQVKADDFTFLAFARVFSGSLKTGQDLYVLPPVHDPRQAAESEEYVTKLQKFTVGDLYLMMGRDLEPVPFVPAGNVVAISGLESLVLKSATLSSTPMCPSFGALYMNAEPIVRVSVEPKHASDVAALDAGLKLLNQADPCVRTFVEDNGEHVLVTAGEVHLQRCLADLRTRYSKIELNVSEPIIPFMETVVPPPTMDRVNETIAAPSASTSDEFIEIKTSNKQATFRLRAQPLPESVVKLLEKKENLMKLLDSSTKVDKIQELANVADDALKQLDTLSLELNQAFEKAAAAQGSKNSCWRNASDRIWAVGPKKARFNLLFNFCADYDRPSLFRLFVERCSSKETSIMLREFDQSVISGFQMRCRSGPLCEEPMRGVAFFIEAWTMDERQTDTGRDVYGPMSGQIIATIKEGCKLAFQRQPQRLMAAMYSCVIRVTTEVLGRMYAVLAKRGGRVIGEEMNEGANLFEISATLPVVESFGFCDEIRKRTSGLASPQLVFSHWEVIDIDPFWVPTTNEELSHFGEKADSENRARKYMNGVRKRKGLATDEKIIEFATKQRTLQIK